MKKKRPENDANCDIEEFSANCDIEEFSAVCSLQALVDISADGGWLTTTLQLMHLVQMCVQGRWISDPSLLTLPHIDHTHIERLGKKLPREGGVTELTSLPELMILMEKDKGFLQSALGDSRSLTPEQLSKVHVFLVTKVADILLAFKCMAEHS